MSDVEGPYRTTVPPETLREHLDDAAWVIVDCRHNLQDFSLGRKLYDQGHIPNAFFADFEHDLAGEQTGRNGRHPLPDPQRFADFLRSVGANDDSQIVAYDEGGDMYAARLWFLCRWIGHENAAVLDGGISAWRALGYPIESGIKSCHPERSERSERSRRTATGLSVHLQPELLVTADDVLKNLRSETMLVIDARAADRYRGEVEPIDPVAGHIPGARNRWFKENFDESGRLKSPRRLREEFAEFGDPERIVHQCGSGVSSAVAALAMEHAGLRGSRIYNGSWSEWCSDPTRPVAKG